MIDQWTLDQAAVEVQKETTRQDDAYGPFSSTVPSVRLAIACLEDEVRECREAWDACKSYPDWFSVRKEATQVAAIALRLLRDVEIRTVD